MRSTVLVVLALLTQACAHMRTDPLLQAMAMREGQSYDTVVIDKGPPTAKEMITNGFVATWFEDKGYHYNQFTHRNTAMGCTLQYVFKNNVVVSWGYNGYCR